MAYVISSACVSCGSCADACPAGAISQGDSQYQIDAGACLDCGSCGAPSCHALAEDVVLGRASEEDCIFKVRERMQYMAGTGDADEYLPAPFRKRKLPQSIPPKKPHTEEGGTLS